MMNTYNEKEGATPFDWNAFLNQETITYEEWGRAARLASCWVTCACGNLCDKIPRDIDGLPFDTNLRDLGVTFSITIGLERPDLAKKVLQKIEARSAEILQELNQNQS